VTRDDIASTALEAGRDVDIPLGTPVVAWTLGTGGYAPHAIVPAWAAVPYLAEIVLELA
jgi:hypothetical protein